MQRIFAKTVSILLHPLLMPTFGVMLMFNFGSYLSFLSINTEKLYLLIFICTFILPLSLVPFFIRHNIIRNIEMECSRERIIPLLISAIFYYLTYYFLIKLGIPSIIPGFILASAIGVSLTLIISVKFKISAHMVGIGGVLGSLITLSHDLMMDIHSILLALIFISGLLGYARLRLNAHNPAQIYTGFLLGLITVSATMIFF